MNLIEETQHILKKYNIFASKNLGQNFLINEQIVQQIIEKAEINSNDLIIEIGPGLGTLTKKLLEKAGKVIAIELDKRMIQILTDRFNSYTNFKLINADILSIDLKELIKLENSLKTSSIKIVANLPYYITTPIIMKLLEEKLPIQSITVMVQKEVADRLTAIPGEKNTGAITYSVYYYAIATDILMVPPSSFIPKPAVDSKVIQLKIRSNPCVNVQNEELLFQIIKYAFMQRRKTLVNALESSNIFKNKEQIIEILKKLNINEKIRGEILSLEDYANITNIVTKM